MRGGRLEVTSACSVATALAASSARLFSAAWAPIASDTMPTNAAATATERREMRSGPTFIAVIPVTVEGAKNQSRLGQLGLRGCRTVWRPIVINLRHRNKQSLNLPRQIRQPH